METLLQLTGNLENSNNAHHITGSEKRWVKT